MNGEINKRTRPNVSKFCRKMVCELCCLSRWGRWDYATSQFVNREMNTKLVYAVAKTRLHHHHYHHQQL